MYKKFKFNRYSNEYQKHKYIYFNDKIRSVDIPKSKRKNFFV